MMTKKRSLTIFSYGDTRSMTAQSVESIRRSADKRRPTEEMAIPVAADFLNLGEVHRCER